jgi:mycofactocin system creatininase family protein
VELGRSACRWAAGVVFVNGHGGNVPTLKKAVELLRYEGRAVAWTSCDLPGADAHAGRTETSLLLDLTPDVVVVDDIEGGCTIPVAELMPRLRAEGVAAVAPNGVLGDPRGSSAEEGARLFAALVDRLVAELTALEVVGAGRLSSVLPDRVRSAAGR